MLGALVRLAYLGEIPAGINNDEVSHGYNAYSILTTGKDEWGKPWPITSFTAFGDYKPPVYIYLTTVWVWLFGLSSFSTRLTSALAGIIAIPLVFLLVQRFYGNRVVAFIAALFLAISPYHVFISRKAAENNLAITWALVGTYAFARAQKHVAWLFASMGFFLLMAFTHTPARGFALLLVACLLVLYGRPLFVREKWKMLVAVSLFFLPTLSLFASWEGQARLYQSTEYVTRGLYARLDETRAACQSFAPPSVCQMAFNRPTARVWDVLENYVSHFSTRTLFVTGIRKFDAGDLRELDTYVLSGHGLFYLFGLPLFFLGLYCLARQLTKKKGLFLAWLLLSPIPDSLTSPGHASRMTTMIPSIEIICAIGLWQLSVWIRYVRLKALQYVVYCVLAAVVAVSVTRFLITYRHYSDYASRAFKFGYAELFQYLSNVEDRYNRIWISSYYGEPYIYHLFFQRYAADKIHDTSHIDRVWVADDQAGVWSQVSRIGKYRYVSEVEAKDVGLSDLVVNGPFGGPRDGNLLHVVRDKRGDGVFYIYEAKQRN